MLLGPSGEGRPRAVAAIHAPVRAEGTRRRLIGRERIRLGLADRPFIRPESQPAEVLEEGGLVLGSAPLAVVILDPEQDTGAARRRQPPGPEGVRDVTEVEVAGRRRREPRAASRREARVSSSRRRPSRPDPVVDRAPRAPWSRRRAVDTARAGRLEASAPRSPSRLAAGSRVPAQRLARPSAQRPPLPAPPRARRARVHSRDRRSVGRAHRCDAVAGAALQSRAPSGLDQPPRPPRSAPPDRRAIDSSAR